MNVTIMNLIVLFGGIIFGVIIFIFFIEFKEWIDHKINVRDYAKFKKELMKTKEYINSTE